MYSIKCIQITNTLIWYHLKSDQYHIFCARTNRIQKYWYVHTIGLFVNESTCKIAYNSLSTTPYVQNLVHYYMNLKHQHFQLKWIIPWCNSNFYRTDELLWYATKMIHFPILNDLSLHKHSWKISYVCCSSLL